MAHGSERSARPDAFDHLPWRTTGVPFTSAIRTAGRGSVVRECLSGELCKNTAAPWPSFCRLQDQPERGWADGPLSVHCSIVVRVYSSDLHS